jgi:hypothetical protein
VPRRAPRPLARAAARRLTRTHESGTTSMGAAGPYLWGNIERFGREARTPALPFPSGLRTGGVSPCATTPECHLGSVARRPPPGWGRRASGQPSERRDLTAPMRESTLSRSDAPASSRGTPVGQRGRRWRIARSKPLSRQDPATEVHLKSREAASAPYPHPRGRGPASRRVRAGLRAGLEPPSLVQVDKPYPVAPCAGATSCCRP